MGRERPRPMSTAATSTACDVTAVCATAVATGAGGEFAFASSSSMRRCVSPKLERRLSTRLLDWGSLRTGPPVGPGHFACLLTACALVREPVGKAFDGSQRALLRRRGR